MKAKTKRLAPSKPHQDREIARTEIEIREEISILAEARREIGALRRSNSILSAKVETMDLFRLALLRQGSNSTVNGVGPRDILDRITSAIDGLQIPF